MKLFWVCILIAGISFIQKNEELLTINDEKIELILNSKVTKSDLKTFKQRLAKIDINFIVRKANYYPFGGLQSIKFEVRSADDKYNGSAECFFINKKSKFGFLINLDEHAKVSFQVGALD